MKEILKNIAPVLRGIGFRGSGQNYRKAEGDFIFVVNFQGSRWGENFYVNLGAQPVFIPAEGRADLNKLEEHECILRRRVGKDWPWQMSDETVKALEAELLSTQAEFFAHAQTMRASFSAEPAEMLLQKFCSGTTKARASLHLARAGIALGHFDKAYELARHGLELAGEKATILCAELREVLKEKPKVQPSPSADASRG